MHWPFGAYVDQLLKERNWKNTDLARATKMSDTYIGYLVRGYTADKPNPPSISVDTLISLSKAFNVSELKLLAAYKGKNPNAAEAPSEVSEETIQELLEVLLKHTQPQAFTNALLAVDGPAIEETRKRLKEEE
jgi:transcriptional regulator with XRE-family HTH domain